MQLFTQYNFAIYPYDINHAIRQPRLTVNKEQSMFKIIFFLMNALDGSRLLNLVNSKWGGAICAIVLGVLLSCALAPFEIWPTAILAYAFMMMLLSVAKSKIGRAHV